MRQLEPMSESPSPEQAARRQWGVSTYIVSAFLALYFVCQNADSRSYGSIVISPIEMAEYKGRGWPRPLSFNWERKAITMTSNSYTGEDGLRKKMIEHETFIAALHPPSRALVVNTATGVLLIFFIPMAWNWALGIPERRRQRESLWPRARFNLTQLILFVALAAPLFATNATSGPGSISNARGHQSSSNSFGLPYPFLMPSTAANDKFSLNTAPWPPCLGNLELANAVRIENVRYNIYPLAFAANLVFVIIATHLLYWILSRLFRALKPRDPAGSGIRKSSPSFLNSE